MKFLKKLFSLSDYKKQKFPQETTDGKVEIIEDKIICTGNNNIHSAQVNIMDLQYAYIIINRNKESLLFLFDFHQNYIPTNYSGFRQAYKELSEKLGFNNQTFFKNVHNEVRTKKEIWRKIHPENFKISQDNNSDYDLGFEILSPEKDFINWDTTYDELEKNPNVFFEASPYGHKISKFKYPIRIGNLILADFSAYFNNVRTDVPVLHFYTHCIDSANSDSSYYKIKERFTKDFLPENQLFGYERDDQNSISFNARDVVLSIVYTYDSDSQFNGGYTSLSIKNQREYPELLIANNYESKIEVSSILELPLKIGTSGDYKRNERVKRRPPKLDSKHPVIWIDNKNSKIGFADQTYCQVFGKNEIRQLTIQNILPAKGAGTAYLMVDFVNNSRNLTVLSGECKIFDSYITQLNLLTGLEVNMAPEHHDC
jgi:hypothetical protein